MILVERGGAIQNNAKSNIVFQVWTEVINQIFGGREKQNMWNL